MSERLKNERVSMKITQKKLAELTGITEQAQVRYEKAAIPNFASYLTSLHLLGFDVLYILTGDRSAGHPPLAPEERAMLAAWRNAPPALREAALAVLACGGAAANGQGGVAVATGHGHAVALGNGANISGSLVGNTLVVGDQAAKKG